MNFENVTALEDNPYVTMDNAEQTENKPATEPTETTPAGTEATPPATETIPPATTPLEEIEIDGIGKVKVEEIKEWQKGNLRQSDYTRKTQELAKQREEHQDALQLFDYLKKNPHLIAKLEEIDNTVNPEIVEKATPQYDMVRDVYMNQRADQLDREVERLKGVYGEVDEIQLYDMATQMRVPVNQLEVIYKSLAYGKEPVHNTPVNTPANTLDENAIIQKAKEQLMAELQQNKQATGTLVATPSSPMNTSDIPKLTVEEERVAKMMGMSTDDYAKWKMQK